MNAFLRQPALRVFLALACANCFGASGAVADDRARAVIEKAIDAIGGKETLKEFPASRGKARGKGELNGMPATFLVSGMMHGPDRMKETTEVDIQGRKLLITRVVNGPKAWVRAGGRTVALQGDALQ